MKTKIQILVLISALAIISSAAQAQLVLGLRQGAAATTFSDKGNLYNDNNLTYSYTAGAFLTVPLNSSLAIQPEFNYVRKGRSNETTELGTATETAFMIHYFQVPVLLPYRNNSLLNRSNSVFFFNVGPYAAFALNTQTRISDKNGPSITHAAENSNNTDWGASLGIGFQTPIRHKDVRFDLRYDMGLTQIKNQPTDYRTKSLSLSIGILL